MLDSVIDEQNRGIINAIQFSAANTGDGLANNGVVVLFARARDKIYGLASYYLVAGNSSYFSYAADPYFADALSDLAVGAAAVNVGSPTGDYYILPGSEEYGQGNNVIVNGSFESVGSNNLPTDWIFDYSPQLGKAEVVSDGCKVGNKCMRLECKPSLNSLCKGDTSGTQVFFHQNLNLANSASPFLPHPSARLAGIEALHRRSWLVRPYRSSRGKAVVIW